MEHKSISIMRTQVHESSVGRIAHHAWPWHSVPPLVPRKCPLQANRQPAGSLIPRALLMVAP